MENMIEAMAAIIRKQRDLGFEEGEAMAVWLRCAALFCHMDFPAATSGDFAKAAVTVELVNPNHHLGKVRKYLEAQPARNRWNEAKAFWTAEGEW